MVTLLKNDGCAAGIASSCWGLVSSSALIRSDVEFKGSPTPPGANLGSFLGADIQGLLFAFLLFPFLLTLIQRIETARQG
jgi:hypothetical protein